MFMVIEKSYSYKKLHGGPRVAPQNLRFKICPVFLLYELKTIYFLFKVYFLLIIVSGSFEVMGGLKIGSWGAESRVFQKYFQAQG